MFWNWLSSGIASQYYRSSEDDHNLWFFQSSHAFALTTSTLQSQENHSFLTPLLASLLYTAVTARLMTHTTFSLIIFQYIGSLLFCFPCSTASLQGSTGSIQNYISYVSMTELLSIIGDQLSHCCHYKFSSLVSRRLSILLNLLLIHA